MRLSKKNQWTSRWSQLKLSSIKFNPDRPSFRERHLLFKKYIPLSKDNTVLEIGSYPGSYLWYFYNYFGYIPWGIEYIEDLALYSEKLLNKLNVPATILRADLFTVYLNSSPKGKGWDLTTSFGFIEHFSDPSLPIKKQIYLTKPGGITVFSIPNHTALNGWILKKMDIEIWRQHNHMSLNDLVDIVNSQKNTDIVFSGYVGHIGFWNARLYTPLRKIFKTFYPLLRAPLFAFEYFGQLFIPNNRLTSPDFILIAKKKAI